MLQLTAENCRTYDAPSKRGIIRILSEGYGCIVEDDHDKRITQAGCTITETDQSPDVGNLSGAARHIAYTLPDGTRMHSYQLTTWGEIDSYQQEWINSRERLDFHQFADLLPTARDLAYPLTRRRDR